MYELQPNPSIGKPSQVVKRLTDNAFIPFDPANTDYQAFKLALESGKNADGSAVELKDADGNTMTAEQVAAFLVTLP